MPSRGSKAAGAFVGEGAGSDTFVVVTELPLEHVSIPVTLPIRVMLFGAGPGGPSLTVPRTRTRSPDIEGPAAATKMPSEVAGFASRSASSSCTKNPLRPPAPSKLPTTTPSITRWLPAGSGVTAPSPWISEMSVAGSPQTPNGGGGAPQLPTSGQPRPSNVSVGDPSHSTAGSNVSFTTVSPAATEGLRRSVLSAVLTSPVPHSVPGSKPTCPIESRTVDPC